MKLFKILVWFNSLHMKSSTKNIVYKLTHKLPNNLRLKILGNSEIMGKTQKWVEAEPSSQSPFQEKKLWYQWSKITEISKITDNRY